VYRRSDAFEPARSEKADEKAGTGRFGSRTLPVKVAVVGAGWAGLSAGIAAVQAGHLVTVFEATRVLGGRARALPSVLPDGSRITLDNGQHILIGAYAQTLALMALVGVDAQKTLLRFPLALVFPDGLGLRFPRWPTGLDALGGILGARRWSLADKLSLLRLAASWRLSGFRCADTLSVASLCAGCSPKAMAELVEPLCVSALNVPPHQASAQVFLRVMQDALFSASGGSNLLLPRVDLSTLFPDAAARWITQRGAQLRSGTRVYQLACAGPTWQVDGEQYDAVVLATPAPEAARIVTEALPGAVQANAASMARWASMTGALRHTAITTVYAWGRNTTLPHPMLTLRSSTCAAGTAPAQFVFDRGQLGGPPGLLAFVISASSGERDALQASVLAQARAQLGCELQPIQTVVEKRAAFACTPGLQRPAMQIAPGLFACADYVDGPYPSTLEGAVRSGAGAVRLLSAGIIQQVA
jgi:squalene-associated FAD-dependent desaturase